MKRYLLLTLVIFTLFGMLGVQVASATPLEVGGYSGLVEVPKDESQSVPGTESQIVVITVQVRSGGSDLSLDDEVFVSGKLVAILRYTKVRETIEDYVVTIMVPAGGNYEVKQNESFSTEGGEAKIYVSYAAVGASGGEGKEGSEGKEGKEGKEGPKGEAGPKGETGPKGESGTEGKTGPEGKEGKAGADGKSLEWYGSWSPTPEYKVLQAVLYNGSSYVALGDNKGEAPSSHTLSWELIAERGSIGPEGKEGKEGAGKEGPEGKTGKEGPEGVEGKEGKEGKEDKELELLRFGSPAETTLSELKETMEVIGWCIIGTMLAGMIGFMVYKVLKTDR